MNVVDILKNKGLKKTAQRIMLIKLLQKTGISLTEGEIKTEMGDLYDRITFYRTVQTLLDTNIIHRITVDNITVKYALNHSNHDHSENHIHFFCKQCHSVTCLEDIAIHEYRIPQGFETEECEVLIKGMCDKCGKE
ncbi:MAG: transcriptional repressor [Bacteroidales bacterium]|jgi:Fur family ferric uptake transcriptional regulator|nr:transcriptional repressor [Bacteroidales bacterium]